MKILGHIKKYCMSIALLSALLSLSGCGNENTQIFPAIEPAIAWPAPPEHGKIGYIGELSTQEDLKKQKSWLQGLGELIFGREKIGVLVGPYAVAYASDDRLFVTDAFGGVVHLFDLEKRDYKQFSEIDNNQQLSKPVGIALVQDKVYVVDSALKKVCVFNADGKFLFSFGGPQLERPSGIAYSNVTGEIFLSDTAKHVINVYDQQGLFLRTIGSRGYGPGQFNFPTQLTVDADGKLYVSDTLNYRIQIFDSKGYLLFTIGKQGDRPGNFAHPCGVAVDTLGNIYVTDRQFENVQIFNNEGQLLMAFGQEGRQPGQFWMPAGITIDEKNRIYVADSYNKRVQVFELLEVNGK